MECNVCNSKIFSKLFSISNFDYIECDNCGLISTDPIPSNIEITNHYYTLSLSNSNYDLGNVNIRTGVQKQIFDYISSLKLDYQKILDIGCLDGILLDMFKQNGSKTYGIELQQKASNTAQNKGHSIFNCMFEEALQNGLDRDFDLVIAAGIIEHVADPNRLIKFCASITKPGGILLIQTPNTSSMLARIMGKKWFCYSPVEHIFHFNINNLTRLLGDNNFRVIKSKPHVKKLKLDYIYHMTNFFGKDIRILLEKIWWIFPSYIKNKPIYAYGGEMLLLAKKISDNK